LSTQDASLKGCMGRKKFSRAYQKWANMPGGKTKGITNAEGEEAGEKTGRPESTWLRGKTYATS